MVLTTVQSDPEGSLWRDPPNYFDDIVYPAYVRAHENIFEGGNVEDGDVKRFPASSASGFLIADENGAESDDKREGHAPGRQNEDVSEVNGVTKAEGGPGAQGKPVENLTLFECKMMSMEEIFERACESVWNASQP